VAKRVKQLLEDAGFGPVAEDRRRGLDHGAWVPLMLMYPEANVPVFELSVQTARDGVYHYDLGKALAPLREEGVLIVGSGSATRNLRTFAPTSHEPVPRWAAEFDAWLKESSAAGTRTSSATRRRRRTRRRRTRRPTTSTRCTSRSAPLEKGARRSSSTIAGPTPRYRTRPIGLPPKTDGFSISRAAHSDCTSAPVLALDSTKPPRVFFKN